MKLQFLFLLFLVLLISAESCDKPGDHLFLEVSHKKSAVNFRNTLKESPEFNVMKYSYFYNGGGVAVGDVNNDGLSDIYFTGNLVASHLYLNEGDWRFKNIAKDAGVEAAGLWNTGVNMIDINADGWLDIYVCRSAAKDPDARRNLLFINRTRSSNDQVIFEEQGAAYGLNDAGYSTQSAFFDYDRDGDLDMYLLNHSIQQFANFNTSLGNLKNRRNPDFGDKLYRNDEGRFTDVSQEAGINSNVLGFGLGVSIGDFNGDTWPDIYISNDYNEEDYLYLNQQDGSFRDQLSTHIDHASLFSMGSDAADINNDGLTDLVTLDMLPADNYRIKLTSGSDNFNKYQLLLKQGFYKQSMRNMLHINQGNSFSEVGQMAGISNTDWSWSALLADYDLDGYQDLFVTNGYLRDYTNMDFLSFAVDMKLDDQDLDSEAGIQELLEHMPKIEVPNQVFKNMDGLSFKDQSKAWGFSKVKLSNGAAYADLDNDGDLDLVVNNINEFAGIYRNTASERKLGNFLKVRLDFQDGRTSAIGSRVKVCTPFGEFHRDLYLSRGFQSSTEPILYFGLGTIEKIDSLTIIWPDGTSESYDYVPINAVYIAKYGTGSKTPKSPGLNPLFVEDELLAFKHQEDDFNDFRVQSLLPKYYSRSGPTLATADINNDGLIDLVCGGAKGQESQVFLGTRSGQFTPIMQSDLALDKDHEDVDLALSDVNQDGFPDLIIASGGNAEEEGDYHYALRLYLNNGAGGFMKEKSFATVLVNAQCLVVKDLNQDGLVDIFVGSAYKAHQYPLPAENYLLINDGKGQFSQVTGLPFASTVVMDAEIADYDQDGQSELIMVGEWEPLQIYSWNSGVWTLEHKSEEKGWYNTG
ncbi:MAG: VCBS repeat-containing protein, partial [Saprospiraceae bacterium]|nr:VCBS repeat-containing protein [Saprospiraceae bacterium]